MMIIITIITIITITIAVTVRMTMLLLSHCSLLCLLVHTGIIYLYHNESQYAINTMDGAR
jgi:hypothetical protein